MIQETKAFIDAVAAGEKCKDWKIVDVRNDESKDWVQADGQILYGVQTLQEYEACKYLDYISDMPAFDKY